MHSIITTNHLELSKTKAAIGGVDYLLISPYLGKFSTIISDATEQTYCIAHVCVISKYVPHISCALKYIERNFIYAISGETYSTTTYVYGTD